VFFEVDKPWLKKEDASWGKEREKTIAVGRGYLKRSGAA
jgi:hypothetical protein